MKEKKRRFFKVLAVTLSAGMMMSGFSNLTGGLNLTVFASGAGELQQTGSGEQTVEESSSGSSTSEAGTFDVGTFTNTYMADSVTVGGDDVVFTKSLINASDHNSSMTLTDGEFNFDIEWIGTDFYTGGNPSSAKESGTKSQSYNTEISSVDAKIKGTYSAAASNDADGKVKLTFTFEDPGSVLGYEEGDHAVFHYTVKEREGTNSHIKYSDGIGKVDITVSRSGSRNAATGKFDLDGKLAKGSIQVTAPAGGKFTNTYTADPAEVSFSATKFLVGKSLKAGDYEFQLSGNSIETQNVKNDMNGKITFAAVKYTNVGDYNVVIREVVPNEKDSHVTYDTTEKKYTVHVTDEDGMLKAEIKTDEAK